MALSDLDVMNAWEKVLTGYKSLGGRIFGFARAIEAEVRKQDEALIRQMLDALETGHEAAMQVAADFHAAYKGHRPDTHAAVDADVDSIAKALTAARARLEGASNEPSS